MIQWGLSVLDFHRHAIDDQRRHSTGVLKAECGHLLLMVTPLDDEPYGRLCGECRALRPTTAAGTEQSE